MLQPVARAKPGQFFRRAYNQHMRAIVCITFAFLLLLASTACPLAKPGAGGTPSAGAVQVSLPAGARAATLTTGDGYKVAAWFWGVKGNNTAPGIILLHQRGKDKSSWGALPGKLVAEGFAVIAIDLRGHGQTTDPSGQVTPLVSLRDADYQAMLNDVAAAHAYLCQQQGVDGDRVGIIGASIGANLALLYGAQDRRVRTIVALSPGLDFKSLQPIPAMKPLDKRPIFLIAATGDKYSLDSIHELAKAAIKDAPVRTREFPGNAHGTDLLTAQAGLEEIIVSGWLLNYLPPGGAPPT
jgi:dienelactone hydrolase